MFLTEGDVDKFEKATKCSYIHQYNTVALIIF